MNRWGVGGGEWWGDCECLEDAVTHNSPLSTLHRALPVLTFCPVSPRLVPSPARPSMITRACTLTTTCARADQPSAMAAVMVGTMHGADIGAM